jgi:hypothetical protein
MDANGRVTVLAVVIAGVIALMVEKGPYTWGNIVFGVTLFVVLLAYTSPAGEEEESAEEKPFGFLENAAFGAAFALCIMNSLGAALQWILVRGPVLMWTPSDDEKLLCAPYKSVHSTS